MSLYQDPDPAAQQHNKQVGEADIQRVQQRPYRPGTFAHDTIVVDNRETLRQRLNNAGVPHSPGIPVTVWRATRL